MRTLRQRRFMRHAAVVRSEYWCANLGSTGASRHAPAVVRLTLDGWGGG
jgi:hypothetical protein